MQMRWFNYINAQSEENHDKQCIYYDDCSICPMAIHQFLLTTTKHTCVRDMSEKEFRIRMVDADCCFGR